MAVGSDALIEYKLIDGKTVNLNVNHIISIEKLSAREIKQQNLHIYQIKWKTKFCTVLPPIWNIYIYSQTCVQFFKTSMKVVDIFSILYPLIYAFPGDT